MIRSMIILTVILSSSFSTFGSKLKTGKHVTSYYSSLVTCRGEWLLWMIPLVCLFKNAHGINQQHKLKQKYIFDRFFEDIRCLYKLKDSGAPFETYFWLPYHSNLWIVSQHYLKTNIYINKTNDQTHLKTWKKLLPSAPW